MDILDLTCFANHQCVRKAYKNILKIFLNSRQKKKEKRFIEVIVADWSVMGSLEVAHFLVKFDEISNFGITYFLL